MAAAPSAERFFTKVANDVLDATEKLSVRMEEGINAIMTGSLLGDDSSSGSGASDGGFPASAPSLSNDADTDDAAFSEEDLMSSPLDGIAESVLSDIMKNQVCLWRILAVIFLYCLCINRSNMESAPLTQLYV